MEVAQGLRWLAIRIGDRFNLIAGVRSGKAPGVRRPVVMRVVPKINIGGAEAMLFGQGAEGWLKCVHNFCVEIHSVEAAAIVEHALKGFRFEFHQWSRRGIGWN